MSDTHLVLVCAVSLALDTGTRLKRKCPSEATDTVRCDCSELRAEEGDLECSDHHQPANPFKIGG